MSAIGGLPALSGQPLSVSALPRLTAHRGKLLSEAERGTPVHAASFIRRREIVLESELLNKANLPLILVHEIFHFVWARLGNRKRAEYKVLVAEERRNNARGEAGESAEMHKNGGRDYVCESFCDTAAWLYAGRRHRVTLGKRWQARRRVWFEATFNGPVKY